jgi:hypothetical protein
MRPLDGTATVSRPFAPARVNAFDAMPYRFRRARSSAIR